MSVFFELWEHSCCPEEWCSYHVSENGDGWIYDFHVFSIFGYELAGFLWSQNHFAGLESIKIWETYQLFLSFLRLPGILQNSLY